MWRGRHLRWPTWHFIPALVVHHQAGSQVKRPSGSLSFYFYLMIFSTTTLSMMKSLKAVFPFVYR